MRLQTSPAIGGIIESCAASIENMLGNVGVGGGDAWTSVAEGITEQKSHASTSFLIRSFSEGKHGMQKEDFSEVVEDLYQASAQYKL